MQARNALDYVRSIDRLLKNAGNGWSAWLLEPNTTIYEYQIWPVHGAYHNKDAVTITVRLTPQGDNYYFGVDNYLKTFFYSEIDPGYEERSAKEYQKLQKLFDVLFNKPLLGEFYD